MRGLTIVWCWVMGFGALLIGAYLAWRMGIEIYGGSVPIKSSVGLGIIALANLTFGLLLLAVGWRTKRGPYDLRFVILNVLLAAFVPVGTLLAALSLYSTSKQWLHSRRGASPRPDHA